MYEKAEAIRDEWTMNYAHQKAQALRDAYYASLETNTWIDNVKYYAGKTSSGAAGGFNELANSYGLGDAGKEVGMSFANGYAEAVKGGLVTAGKGGKFTAKKLIPAAGLIFAGQDAVTFSRGFRKGWNDYER